MVFLDSSLGSFIANRDMNDFSNFKVFSLHGHCKKVPISLNVFGFSRCVEQHGPIVSFVRLCSCWWKTLLVLLLHITFLHVMCFWSCLLRFS